MTTSNLMSLPVDIPWKRLACSTDMIDEIYRDRKFPPKWKSSIAIFYHEPEELPEDYSDRKITYIKIVASITSYQVGQEVGIANTGLEPGWTSEEWILQEYKSKAGKNYPCHGAVLQVSVFPYPIKTGDEKTPLNDYPYFMDFEPKKRELYETVTESGEVLSKSADNLNVRKGVTSLDSLEDVNIDKGWKFGASASVEKGTTKYSGSLELGKEQEVGYQSKDSTENVNITTTDGSREKRETYSHSTNITQMYQTLNSYHIGSNRAVFFMQPRPHIMNTQDFNFINGPQKLEGIQEFFMVINRPKHVPSICIESFLETAHLDVNIEKVSKGSYEYFKGQIEQHLSKVHAEGSWAGGDENAQGRNWKILAPPALIDGKYYNTRVDRSEPKGNGLGYSWKPQPDGSDYYSKGDTEINVTPYDTQIEIDAKVIGTPGVSDTDAEFEGDIILYYITTEPVTLPKEEIIDRTRLFITGRGLSTCPLELAPRELSDRSQVSNIGSLPHENSKIENVEWISYEKPIPVHPDLYNSSVLSGIRISLANELNRFIGNEMVESISSIDRYPVGEINFFSSNVFQSPLKEKVLSMRRNDPNNLRIDDIETLTPEIKNKIRDSLEVNTIKELYKIPLNELKSKLNMSDAEVREIRLNLLGLVKK